MRGIICQGHNAVFPNFYARPFRNSNYLSGMAVA